MSDSMKIEWSAIEFTEKKLLYLTAEAQEGILKGKMGKFSWTLDGSSPGRPLAAGRMVHPRVFERGGRRKGVFPG